MKVHESNFNIYYTICIRICVVWDDMNWTFSLFCPQYWPADETCVYDADYRHDLSKLTSRGAGALALDERWEIRIHEHDIYIQYMIGPAYFYFIFFLFFCISIYFTLSLWIVHCFRNERPGKNSVHCKFFNAFKTGLWLPCTVCS